MLKEMLGATEVHVHIFERTLHPMPAFEETGAPR
jgi:hypothetical protein